MGSHFGVGEFTTHFSRDFSGDWFTGGTIWILTRGHLGPEKGRVAARMCQGKNVAITILTNKCWPERPCTCQ